MRAHDGGLLGRQVFPLPTTIRAFVKAVRLLAEELTLLLKLLGHGA